MQLSIITGNANRPLAESIAKLIDTRMVLGGQSVLRQARVDHFPDGESSVQIIENIRGHDVFLIQPTNAPANENIFELLVMIDAVKRASAARITVVIPYYGYARQDRKDKPRVPITAKLVANLLTTAGANRIIAMDLHAPQIQGFFDIPFDHLFAAPVFVKYIKDRGLDKDLVVMAPDVGSTKLASMYAGYFSCNFGFVTKKRVDANHVEALGIVGDVSNKNVLLVDDMTASAGTIISAGKVLREAGAKRVFAAVSHGLFTPLGYQRIAEQTVIDEIITTNSTNLPDFSQSNYKITVLDVSALLAEAVLRTHQNESITDLFTIKGF